MIKVTVELISAIDGHTEILGTATIANDGRGTKTRGNYNAVFASKRKLVWRLVGVNDFPRERLNAWDLLYRCLHQAVGDRNK